MVHPANYCVVVVVHEAIRHRSIQRLGPSQARPGAWVVLAVA